MKVIINGANGKMGKVITELALNGYRGASLAAAIDINSASHAAFPIYEHLADFDGDADIIIDFSHHSITSTLIDYAISRNLPVVIATTGHTDAEMNIIEDASKKIAIFKSANMSVGIALLAEMAKRVASVMQNANIEIVEAHHNMKLDSPSGTALLLANSIKEVRTEAEFVYSRHGMEKRSENEIGIHALRYGSVIGEHEIIISDGTETIKLRHEAHSRSLFAQGAICAAAFLVKQPSGMYNMKSMLGN
ncbi:MAG: 4-hydroxy-tetrahydrodipicolinate reductase [Clostridiales bacterium GWF2_38_85]|nr:MAG: 4-hydroxy-tetrahydrodipicolinate reductase [Clostridiales bacterium GWF2_38_85]